jgi:hypothetical protein
VTTEGGSVRLDWLDVLILMLILFLVSLGLVSSGFRTGECKGRCWPAASEGSGSDCRCATPAGWAAPAGGAS